MAYSFDLKQACGGYAYFATFSHYEDSKSVHEVRVPSLVDEKRFERALSDLGLKAVYIDSDASYRQWLNFHGWAMVNVEFARKAMPQWLRKHQCLKSALGSFIDISIASPGTLKRTLRGKQKQRIYERDGKQCLRCGSDENLTLQHVQPFSRGGETNSSNLVTLCAGCNQDLRDELDIELYELAGLRSGVDVSLMKSSDWGEMAFMRARNFSHNLMHTRCEMW
jgi:hypothetical protein